MVSAARECDAKGAGALWANFHRDENLGGRLFTSTKQASEIPVPLDYADDGQ